MKRASLVQDCLANLPWLLVLIFSHRGLSNQRIHCQWGPYGEWSECDGCTNLKTRSRAMVVYAQFGGNPCDGERTQTSSCETTKGCPLEDGCGDRFRCRSGKCISRSLVCNGDQDCEEDNDDEHMCTLAQAHIVCENGENAGLPPNIEQLGLGYDAVLRMTKGSVINTKSFGGQCRMIFSGNHRAFYRLPLSVTQYNFLVQVQKDYSDEQYSSKWKYAKDIVNRETVRGTTSGYRNYDFHETEDKTQRRMLLVLKNKIEVAQFQHNAPQHLPISEEFWKALVKIPTVYDYAAYRQILKRFGTHYRSEGRLGGSLDVIVSIDQETATQRAQETWKYDECERTERWFLFFPIITENCDRDSRDRTLHRPPDVSRNIVLRKADVTGGQPQHAAALKNMDLNSPATNWEMYTSWSESVRSFPYVFKQTLRPLSELVKEVQCAEVKKVYLRRAIDQYLFESHPCHCRPCRNNGLAVMDGDKCVCICKRGTSGLACEQGQELEGQPGVINGGWSCWSAWTLCSGGQRSRSRSCSNPSPQNGGQHCNGEPIEKTECEDQELQYLKTMEPQCFDLSISAKERCGTPPALVNGFILDLKDVYLVGSRIEYTCTLGYHLIGNRILECAVDQTWSGSPGLCMKTRCKIDSLSKGVSASPWKESYDIGERITLSCPLGSQIRGESEIICDSSLQLSPNPAETTCSKVTVPQQRNTSAVHCKPWEKFSSGKCICKMPFECTSSLVVCASSRTGTLSISVCGMLAMQCLGRRVTLTEDSRCQWPKRTSTSCTNCPMWETCDAQTNMCRCKEPTECLVQGMSVCVRVGEDLTAANQTMSECEAGLRKCKGDTVTVISPVPCES
ncbi:complement component C7 [Lampris incognitus]|uniref:complement component C7 n=1 Tax=Lampris incognitus TaxID=2546036 RepID=UPI0024B5B3E1|nr:complement component C7 [Lampris incognitus]